MGIRSVGTLKGLVYAAAASLMLAAACGDDKTKQRDDDDDDNGGGGGAQSNGVGGSGGAVAGPGSGGNTNASSSSGNGGGAGGSMCDLDENDVCESCIASKCATEAAACCALTGCLDVVKCAQEKMCAGIDCYMPDTCMAEIDIAGLTVAQNEATAVGTCASVQCTTECALPGGGGGAGGGN